MKKSSIILILIVLVSVESGITQKLPKVEVTITYDSLNHKNLLRWAPDNSSLWLLANQYGYTIEKYYYQRDGKLLPIPLKKEILVENLKPKPLDKWEKIVHSNDYAAIAAQSLYGERINLNGSQNDMVSILNKSKEIQSRFSFSLFAADYSTDVADFSGLYFEDNEVKKNERYLYRVFANIPDSVLKADTAVMYYGPDDFSPLPSPIIESIVQKEDHVVIKWLSGPHKNVFNSFVIERSFNGEKFINISSLPIVNFGSNPSNDDLFASYIDTTKYSGKAYYRIKGKNTFGQLSISSDTISIKKTEPFDIPFPQIDSVKSDKNANYIHWSATGDLEFINKVFLEKSDKSEGKYQLVELDSLSIDKVLKDSSPEEFNYYRVGVIAGDYLRYTSPFLFQNIDSIPPSKPNFVKYFVKDSLLHLSWNANPEADLAGYRIYKSQKRNAEPSLIYDKNELDTVTIFNENLSFINNERYYYLVAFDKNGNASELSERYKIELPDIVPPSPPQITKVSQSSDSLIIDFVQSSSRDVEGYLLYRKIDNSLYELINRSGLEKERLIDLVEIEGEYKYRLIVLDKHGNEGVSKAYPINVYLNHHEKIDYEIGDRDDSFEIKWNIPKGSEIRKVKIYYKKNEQYSLVREVNTKETSIILQKRNRKKENIHLIFF